MFSSAFKFWFVAAAVLVVWMPGTALGAFALTIDGDRISIEANQVPLQHMLKTVSNYGITIRIDPDINPLITISFRNRLLEDGLKAVLRPHNHIFLWRTPAGDPASDRNVYSLDEIHVFRAGRRERIVPLEEAAPSTQQVPPAPEQAATKVLIVDNKVFVPVVLGYQDREVETSLIFDTGAGTIVLHQNVADELAIEATEISSGRGVGGIPIQTRSTRIDYVRVGPHTKKNLRVDIVDYQGAAEECYNGLLGMNFIRGLKYTIDFDQQVIQWNP